MPNTDLVFSLATSADVDAIANLVRAAYARWVPVIGREPRPMLADYGKAVIEHRIDLLHDGPQLVGLIETELRDGYLWIENVAVAPPAQGLGHGRQLLAHAEEIARTAGVGELRLLTNAAFAGNVALYLRLGYAVSHSEPFMGGTTLHLTKRLA